MDTSKSVFVLHGVDAGEQPVLRRKLRRKQVLEFFAKLAQLKQLGRWSGYFCGVPVPKCESNQRHRLANRL
jgi:transposase